MIGILDYGMGNLRSVQKALQCVGADAHTVSEPEQIAGHDKLILPGVGNFADGMDQLQRRALIEPLHAFIQNGRPLLGICLGMQLLLDGSTEDAPEDREQVPGLGVVSGAVKRFSETAADDGTRLKVPHMGWNRLDTDSQSPLFAGLGDDAHVYFVHSYYCQPTDETLVAATADYGGSFCAALHRDNVWATQFHPEKSQRVGLQILRNFAAA